VLEGKLQKPRRYTAVITGSIYELEQNCILHKDFGGSKRFTALIFKRFLNTYKPNLLNMKANNLGVVLYSKVICKLRTPHTVASSGESIGRKALPAPEESFPRILCMLNFA
jgi:hypothetical protein